MPVMGVPNFNAVAVLEIDAINFVHTNVQLVAHAAFINTDNGNTYGETTCTHWSQNTIDKLHQLREAMEYDVGAMVFQNDAAVVQAGGPVASQTGDGIGEYAGTREDAEQA